MANLSLAPIPLTLSITAPLQDDKFYTPFLHHTTSNPCSCILCLPSSFSLLLSHLSHHKLLIKQHLLSFPPTAAIPFIPHACLSIDATWGDWFQATKNAAWETMGRRGKEDEQKERQRIEDEISQMVNERRVDEVERKVEKAFSPFISEDDHRSTPQGRAVPFSPFVPPLHYRSPSPPPSSLPPSPSSDTSLSSFSPFASPASSLPYFVLPTLSVRSSLSLYLTLRAYPPGSSVLLTAINIPDMLHVLSHFQLTPIPIDIDPLTLTPSLSSLSASILPSSVALLVAHIYGKMNSMGELIAEAHRLGLEVWEDIAEGWRGYSPSSSLSSSTFPYFAPYPLGHPQSDLVLFSFGAIKCNTAFGGGLLLLPPHKQAEASALLALHHSLPASSASQYLSKCFKVLAAQSLLNIPLLSSLTMTSSRLLGIDHKSLVVDLLRGFPSRLIFNLQHQPSVPLLRQLQSRLSSYDHQHLQCTMRGEIMRKLIEGSGVVVGSEAESVHYWLYPLLVDEMEGEEGTDAVDEVLAEFTKLGVDAYRGATQLTVVRGGGCVEAESLMDRVIYLPVHGRVPVRRVVEMAAIVEIVWEERRKRRARNCRQLTSRL